VSGPACQLVEQATQLMNQTLREGRSHLHHRGPTLSWVQRQHNFQFANGTSWAGAFSFINIDNFLKGISSGFYTALTASSEPRAYIRNQLYGPLRPRGLAACHPGSR